MKKIISLLLLVLVLTTAIFSFVSCKKEECAECYGEGVIECESCEGGGIKLCFECDGNGRCSECLGDGMRYDWKTCSICDGEGFFVNPFNWDNIVKCSTCEGLGGTLVEVRCYGSYHDDNDGDGYCDNCGGSGKDTSLEACGNCNGSGKIDCSNCVDGYIEE